MRPVYCVDDIGLSEGQIRRAAEASGHGLPDQAGILGNSSLVRESVKALKGRCALSLHFNITEGRCLCPPRKLPLLAGPDGVFYGSFSRLLLLSLVRGRDVEEQAYLECRAQLQRFLSFQDDTYRIRFDSHRHFHMIPAVLRGVVRACRESGRETEHLRFPAERLSLYAAEPSLRSALKPGNVLKVLVLDLLALRDRRILEEAGLLSACPAFFGVALSGCMTAEHIRALLKTAGKDRAEVLLHPFGLEEGEACSGLENCRYEAFYRSPEREKEKEALKELRK